MPVALWRGLVTFVDLSTGVGIVLSRGTQRRIPSELRGLSGSHDSALVLGTGVRRGGGGNKCLRNRKLYEENERVD